MNWLRKLLPRLVVSVSGEETDVGTCGICGCLVPTIRWDRHLDWHTPKELPDEPR